MRFNLFHAFAFASTASAAVVCTYQTPGTNSENGVVNKNCCTDLTVIFARGTAETGNVGTYAGPPFFTSLRNQLGNTKVTIQGVNYPASLSGLLNDGADGGPTMVSLIKQALSQCPNTKVIAAGYSQGAEVVHNALSSSSVANLVKGAVLFGDPDSKKAVGALSSSKVKRFCAPGDTICENGILIITASHLSYGLYADQAASAARSFAGV